MNLNFTPRMLKEIEWERGESFLTVLSDLKISAMILFIKKGLGIGTTEEEAEKALEEYLKVEDNDITTLHVKIMEDLKKTGFLPRAVNLKNLKKNMKEAIEKEK